MSEDQLLYLLKKKRGFFEAILELTEEEKHFSLDEWIKGLKQKKTLLACIEKIDKELSFFRASLDHLSQELTEEVERIKEVIQEILYLDKINQEQRKKEIKHHEIF